MVSKYNIRDIIDYTVKCLSKARMQEKISEYSLEERINLLDGKLTPLEWEDYNRKASYYDNLDEYIQKAKEKGMEHKIPKIIQMIKERNEEVDNDLFEYNRRIIENRELPNNPIPKVDKSKYQFDNDLDEPEKTGDRSSINKIEQEHISSQENINLTEKEIGNLGMYFTDSYLYIKNRINHNKEWIGDNISDDEQRYWEGNFRNTLRSMDNAINKTGGLEYDTRLFHGGVVDIHLQPGEHGVWKSYTSATFQEKTMINHNIGKDDYWEFEILAPKGTKGICANDSRFKAYSFIDEHEYLLGRNTGYTVLSIDYDNHRQVVLLDDP